MKRFWLVLFGSVLFGSGLFGADLGRVRTVYLLPMGRGLDQYLANRLTNEGVFRVVTDPKTADAIFTDRIGEGFESQMTSLVPPPPPPPAPAAAPAPDKNGRKAKEEAKAAPPINEVSNKLENPAMNSSFGRGRGTIFLVDMKSHEVLWSSFQPSRGTDAREMDRSASDIVTRIKKDLGGKK